LNVSKIKKCKYYVNNVLSNDFCTTLSTMTADFISPNYLHTASIFRIGLP